MEFKNTEVWGFEHALRGARNPMNSWDKSDSEYLLSDMYVLDEGLPLHPLKEQRESVRDWRQIGLGIFGLADLLIKVGFKYGSKESINLCDMIGLTMADEALKTSAELAPSA